MSEAVAAAAKLASGAYNGTKGTVWKYFGAMMMEQKNGSQAVSYTRTLGLILFGICVSMWTGLIAGEVPDSMIYTLWGLIGIKGGKDIAAQFSK